LGAVRRYCRERLISSIIHHYFPESGATRRTKLAFHHSPDPKGVAEHLKTVADDAHLAFGGIVPLDRKVGDPESQLMGNEQDFDIEGETIDLLACKDHLRSRAPEGLEPTLSVVHADHRKAPKDRIECLAQVASHPALVFRDSAFGMLTIPKEDIHIRVGAKVFHEGVDLSQRNAEVGVHVKNQGGCGGAHSCSHSETLPPVFLIHNDPQIRLAGCRLGG